MSFFSWPSMKDFTNHLCHGIHKKTLAWFMLVCCTLLLYKLYSASLTTEMYKVQTIHDSLLKESRSVQTHANLITRENSTSSVEDDAIISFGSKIESPAIKNKDGANVMKFDINGTDVMVLLHIQKTSGSSFGRHLMKDLSPNLCKVRPTNFKRRYTCTRPNSDSEWMFSRFTLGWLCGVHADWTSLTECVPDQFEPLENGTRRYFYITVLREPVARYLSEWGHVVRGAIWEQSYLKCNGEIFDYPTCWKAEELTKVSLDEFINCANNLANNRQTRMLANLREVGCMAEKMDPYERDRRMLESAKNNLKDMAFFGLTERQRQSQILFEKTFDLHFNVDFVDLNNATHASSFNETSQQIDKIKELNYLDIELYEFAVKLFDERIR